MLLFFSTIDGDVWVLDIKDASALCLMKEHEPRNALIEETSGNFSIGWEATFAIDGDQFVGNDGARTTIFGGYTTVEIENTIRIAKAALAPPYAGPSHRPDRHP